MKNENEIECQFVKKLISIQIQQVENFKPTLD